MHRFILETLNGVTFAGLLFLLGSGFTLIFGLMRVVNLTHGATYLVGGYAGYSTIKGTGSYVAGLAAGAVSMAAFGVLLERGLVARVRDLPMAQLLLTLGLALVMGDLALAAWGGDPITVGMPGVLNRSSHFGSITYPNERLVILGVAIVTAIGLYVLMVHTRTGAVIRAGVDDREMVSALGVNIRRTFTAVFVLGTFLAGLGGVLGASILPLAPGQDSTILIFALILAVVGGLGSLGGAVIGSLVIGLLYTYGTAYFPSLAYFALFAPVVVILLWRPQGLLGRVQA